MATASRVGMARPRLTNSAETRSLTTTIAFAPICRATSRIAITCVSPFDTPTRTDLTELHVPPIPRHRVQYEHGLTWRVDHLGVWDEARGRCSAANYSDDYCEGERNVLHR